MLQLVGVISSYSELFWKISIISNASFISSSVGRNSSSLEMFDCCGLELFIFTNGVHYFN